LKKEEDDDLDPEVTLDYIIDGIVDSGRFEKLEREDQTLLLE
jgi:hypothetical protein